MIRELKQKKLNKQFCACDVVVFWGKTGLGKTRRAYAEDPDLYRCFDVKELKWFDGYEGENTILIDDFRGAPDFAWLLQVLDGYPFSVQVKGGTVWKQWKKVIITSNVSPDGWYTQPWDDTNPLKRRLTVIHHVTEPYQPFTFNQDVEIPPPPDLEFQLTEPYPE